MTLTEAVKYEIYSSYIGRFIFFKWGQDLLAKWYLRKAKRKHALYLLYGTRIKEREKHG